jgi:Ca2+-binding RTX toxin-like protein
MATFTGGTAFGITSDFSGFDFINTQLPTNLSSSGFSFVGLLSGPGVPSTQVRVTVDGTNLAYSNINGIPTPIGGFVEKVTVVAANTNLVIGKIEFPGAGVNLLQISDVFPLSPTIFSQNDTIIGTDFNDRLFGYNGQDFLLGKSGNDRLDGGAGNDVLNGSAGNDTLVGGVGNDIYYVDSSADVVSETSSLPGIDLVFSSANSFTMGANVERMVLQTGAIAGTGNAINNSIFGNTANNRLSGGAGNDVLNGSAGNDTLVGGVGNDIYYVDSSADVVSETSSLPGIDLVFSSANSFTMGANVERMVLQTGAISGTGNAIDNSIFGNTANNRLSGGAGNDFLNGDAGNDTLVGGVGNDILTGGTGLDSFTFNASNEGIDAIVNFSVTDDAIAVSATGFGGGLIAGVALSNAQFMIGTQATTTNHRFIYNQSSGAVFFDRDGVGGIEQVQIARLNGGLAMTSENLAVIA